jgi:hypothetical protein
LGKTVREVYSLPAQEILGWEEYFRIYPFTQDREDARAAMIAERITNSIGMLLSQNARKTTYNPIPMREFLPDYLGERKSASEKSLEEQRKDWERFKSQARQIEKESGIKIFKEGGD